jgi:hypothetical protein
MGDEAMTGSCRWCHVTIVGEDGEVLVNAVLSGPGAPGVLVVDVVGRLALVAERTGCAVRVSELCPELGIEVIHGDAGVTDVYIGALPAQIL